MKIYDELVARGENRGRIDFRLGAQFDSEVWHHLEPFRVVIVPRDSEDIAGDGVLEDLDAKEREDAHDERKQKEGGQGFVLHVALTSISRKAFGKDR